MGDDNIIILVFPRVTGYETATLTAQELQTILQRACNTWSDIPPHILQLCDRNDRFVEFLKHI